MTIDKIITFEQDTAERKQWFTAASFSHPAKMHLSLQMYLIEHYTKRGDTILDPMTGSGTILVACALERNVICVELEEKFCDMVRGFDCDGKIKGYRDVWVEPQEAGWVVYCGMEAIDHLFDTKDKAEKFYEKWEFKGAPRDKGIKYQEYVAGHFTTEVIPAKCGKGKNHKPHFVEGNWQKIKSLGPMLGYKMGEAVILQGDARQLDNLLVDKCIFSPPYAEAQSGGGIAQEGYTKDYQPDKISGGNLDPVGKRSYMPENTGSDPNNIQNLPYGEISAVISSPPYEGTVSGKELPESEKLIERKSGKEKWGKHLRLGRSQLTKYADAVITSPPYEGSLDAHHGHSEKDRVKEFDKLRTLGYKINPNSADNKVRGADYSENLENIGNLKSENYLEAMLTVYRQCYKVLKPKGLFILVTKNFIREKKIVRLDSDTIKLCEQAGFTLIERLKRKLTQMSFWRRIYQQKYPDAPTIDFEDVLVFERTI